MAETNQREAAARLILGRGIRFIIKDAPFLYRLFRLNKFEISHLRAGTIVEISRIIDENNISDIQKPDKANQKLDVVALIIAVAILNREKRINRFSGRLAKFLLWKVPAQTLMAIYFNIASINRITDFMIITTYFAHQAQTMMSPKNLGQQEKGS